MGKQPSVPADAIDVLPSLPLSEGQQERNRTTTGSGGGVLRRHAEAAVAFAVALTCAGTLIGPHIRAGGRYLDDWWLAAYLHFPRALGFPSARAYLDFYSGARPGAILYWLLTYDLFGFHDELHRALSVALGGALAALTYLLLRELRLDRLDAGAIGVLTLALPIADSIHFWITPAVAQLCLAAYVGGLLFAVRALRSRGRHALVLHAGSLACLATSLLLAETMLPAIGLTLLVYCARGSWQRAMKRWLVDLVLVGVAVIHYAILAPARTVGSAASGGAATHALTIANQLVTLFTSTLIPGAASRGPVLLELLACAALVAAGLTRAAREGADAGRLRGWCVAAAIAAPLVLASYAVYVPADASYLPLAVGVGNRVNIGALLPFSVLVYAVVGMLAAMVPDARLRTVVTLALLAAVLVPAVQRTRADRELWAAAASEQATTLSGIHSVLPAPPRGAALLVVNAPGVVTRFEHIGHQWINQPVPVFSTWWELDVAVKLSYRRPDLDAYPIWANQPPQVICGAHDVYQLGLDGVRHALAYGHVYVVDVIEPSAERLDGPGQCRRITGDAETTTYDLPV